MKKEIEVGLRAHHSVMRLHRLRTEMLAAHEDLKREGFNKKHLAELKGAAQVVRTWIMGVQKKEI